MLTPRRVAIFALLGSGFVARAADAPAAAETALKVFTLTLGASVEMQAPPTWRTEVNREGERELLTFNFWPAEGDAFVVMISPSINGDAGEGGDEARRLAALRTRIEKEAAALGPSTKEKNLSLLDLPGAKDRGWYFTATDLAPKPGEYEYLTRAWVDRETYSFFMTVLTHAIDAPAIPVALEMLGSASVRTDKEARSLADRQARSAVPVPGSRQELRLPGRAWSLAFELPGFHESGRDARNDGSMVMMKAENSATGLIISVFLERETEPVASKVCRDRYWKAARKSPLPKTKVRTYETDRFALGDYTIYYPEKAAFTQRHLNAYVAVEDVCVDIHISRENYTKDDEPLFSAILDSVEVKRD
jgi:hypothetical protein